MKNYLILETDRKKGKGVDEEGNIHTFDMPAGQLISAWCLRNAATMKGRQDAARTLFGWHQKIPVLISENSQEIWFPTAGEKAERNTWIRYEGVFSFHKKNEYETLIRLINGTECVIACNVRTVRMQMKRCQQLLDYLSRKKEEDSGHPLKLL